MRLLNTTTLQLEEFVGGPRVTYAILSHTWDREEVTFQDMISMGSSQPRAPPPRPVVMMPVECKRGFAKIASCCAWARAEGYQYVWIDTCCIDKSSSAELSEAINSMYKWYQGAEVCYALLSDVDCSSSGGLTGDGGGDDGGGDDGGGDDGGGDDGGGDDGGGDDAVGGVGQQGGGGEKKKREEERWKRQLHNSRWFTRGWTLQELIAPLEVVFVDDRWRELGTRETLAATLEEITGIDGSVLRMEKSLGQFSVAQRMSWAAGRNTTRVEDEAYCLMGLFDVNMPLLYGEGRKAFRRLQLEIMRQSTDRSILAWASPDSHGVIEGLLAASPAMFEDCGGIQWKCEVETGSPGKGEGEAGRYLNSNACHDIVGFSLKIEAGVLEPPPSGRQGTPMVFTEYWNFAHEDGSMLPERGNRADNPLADLVHFPRDVWELYPHERAFREFDYGFLRHKGRTVVLVMLNGCTKGGGKNGPEYTVGITLCLDSEGLMKRVHFPSRFLVPEHARPLFADRVQTLHASLLGSEVLQRPPVPNFAKCMVRVPDMSELPYSLAYTIPAMADNSSGVWYLERWGEIPDQASLELQPCFSLHRNGAARAMAFHHKTNPSLSFMVIFTLVKPPVLPSMAKSVTALPLTRRPSSTKSAAEEHQALKRASTTLLLPSQSPAVAEKQWFQVSYIYGPDVLRIGFETDLAAVLPPPSTAPIYSWRFNLPDPSLSLSVKMRKAPRVYNAGLKNYNALLGFESRTRSVGRIGGDGGKTSRGWRKDNLSDAWLKEMLNEGN